MEVMLFGQTILSDKKSSCSSASKGHVSLCSQAPICRPAALQVTFHRAVLQRSCLGSELSPPDKKKPADTCKLAVTGTAMDPRHKTWIKSFLLGPLKKTFGGFSKFIGGVFILVVCSTKDHKKTSEKKGSHNKSAPKVMLGQLPFNPPFSGECFLAVTLDLGVFYSPSRSFNLSNASNRTTTQWAGLVNDKLRVICRVMVVGTQFSHFCVLRFSG